jgi:hypothetical protein
VHLLFAASVADGDEPRVVEVGGTTDDVAWVEEGDIASGTVPVLDVVTYALSLAPARSGSAHGGRPTMGA